MTNRIQSALLKRGNFCIRNQSGSSVVEVMFAIVIFMIIMVGGLNYFTLPQSTIVRQKLKRLAVATAQQRMETLLALEFTQITADSNETAAPIILGNITGNRNTTISEVDDAADGLGGSDADGDIVDYKTITVDISWTDGRNQQVTLSTKVSAFGN